MGQSTDRNSREYWNKRAETFPCYQEGEHTFEAGMLRRISAMGIDFSGKRVLDVGCGCGQYTIRLAMQADRVTALDISDTMLELLRKDARRLGLTNIEYVRSDWLEFNGDGPYDILFCSMAPAVSGNEGKNRLLNYAGAAVVYMGFQERIPSALLLGLYALYGETMRSCDSAADMRAKLDEQKIIYQAETVTGRWDRRMDMDEALNLCMATVYNFAATPSEKDIRRYLDSLVEADGMIDAASGYVIDILIWKNAV